jgi:phosphatidylserine/phosphatidylglycerophosphate/cardiolipin synthase-like enzyme
VTTTLPSAIGSAAETLSPGAIDAMASFLERGGARGGLAAVVPTASYRAVAEQIVQAWDGAPDVPPAAVGLALRCAQERVEAAKRQHVSIVWTGPESAAVATRRTDQALLQVVHEARERLIVVSFAVYRVSAVATALVAAAERGVDVALILEGDRVRRLGREVAEHATVYEWPLDRRPTLEDGSRAALHAKCAVADGEVLLVSSANLTESAMTLNMELGLMVKGGGVPALVGAHFDALIRDGELRLVR